MLKLTKHEAEILGLLLNMSPSKVAEHLSRQHKTVIKPQAVYSAKNAFLKKVQNAQEFLAVAKSKYKPLLRKRLNTPKIMPIGEEDEDLF